MQAKILLFALVLSFSFANDFISAIKVPGNVLGIKVNSKAWMSASFKEVDTFPMVSINSNDLLENKLNYENGRKKVMIKAIYDGKNIAFLLKWKDNTKNIIKSTQTDSFDDSFGIEFPEKSDRETYIDFGDKNNGVIFYHKSPDRNITGTYGNSGVLSQFDFQNLNIFKKDSLGDTILTNQGVFSYHGFNDANKLDTKLTNITMDILYKNGFWYGSLSKQLVDKYLNLNSGAFLVSFSLYDGDKKQRGRFRNLTPWLVIKLIGVDGGEQLINQTNEKIVGNIANGEKLALKNCSICHNYKNIKKAPQNMAPNLSYIGGYGNLTYLKESIIKPSEVIVSDFTPNAHPNFSWRDKQEDGTYISVMPSFEWMSENDLNDLLAYLQTLR
jgi:complex iron-sulfur molybdoenzyme family reductase subunit gamma